MKIRQGFVSNSSSSSFLCVRTKGPLVVNILSHYLQIDLSSPIDMDLFEENPLIQEGDCGSYPIKDSDLSLYLSDDELSFVGYDLNPKDLEHNTVAAMKIKFIQEIDKIMVHGLKLGHMLNPMEAESVRQSLDLDYGEWSSE